MWLPTTTPTVTEVAVEPMSYELSMESIFNYQVFFFFILHLINHSIQFFACLLNTSLVSLNPDDSDSTVGVRNVNSNISLRLNFVYSAASFSYYMFVILGINLYISKCHSFYQDRSLCFQLCFGFFNLIRRSVHFDGIIIIEHNMNLL